MHDEKIKFDNNQFCLNLEMMEIKICFQTYKLFKHKVVQSWRWNGDRACSELQVPVIWGIPQNPYH